MRPAARHCAIGTTRPRASPSFRWSVHPEFAELFVADVRFDGHRNVLDVREAPEFAARAAVCAADVAGKLLADHGLTTRDVDAVIACPLSRGSSMRSPTRWISRAIRSWIRRSRGAHTAALLISLESLLHDPGCSRRAYAALRRGGRRDHDRHRALPAVSARRGCDRAHRTAVDVPHDRGCGDARGRGGRRADDRPAAPGTG